MGKGRGDWRGGEGKPEGDGYRRVHNIIGGIMTFASSGDIIIHIAHELSETFAGV